MIFLILLFFLHLSAEIPLVYFSYLKIAINGQGYLVILKYNLYRTDRINF